MQADQDPSTARDGRSSRWDAHRDQRRSELLGCAVRAIREHGPTVSMDEIAALAGTSKPVLYRHFGDKSGVHRAVTQLVGDRISSEIELAIEASRRSDSSPRLAVTAVVEHYLALVERDPQVYRFVVSEPPRPDDDPVRSLSARIAAQLRGHLEEAGLPPSTAEVWAPALVGLVRAAADDWLAGGAGSTLNRDELATSLTRLAWWGLRGA